MSNASERRQAGPPCRQAARGEHHQPAYSSIQPLLRPQPSPRLMTPLHTNALPIAAILSIVLHGAALISWPQPTGPGDAGAAVRQLDVRITQPSSPAEPVPPPATPLTHPHAFTPAAPSTSNPARHPTPPAASPAPPSEAPESPQPVFPIEALSRLPTLVTEISPEDWPSTPGAPSGRFRIEVDVGPDGRVTRVNPVCEPQMCEAAATYSGAIIGWRFVPAEILGHRVSSRIHVEFEIGSPENEGFSATPVSPSRPAAPIVRPSEAAP